MMIEQSVREFFVHAEPDSLGSWRSTVEHTIRFLKSFAILVVPFRHHDRAKHELVFRVICKLFNFCLPDEPIQLEQKDDLLFLDLDD